MTNATIWFLITTYIVLSLTCFYFQSHNSSERVKSCLCYFIMYSNVSSMYIVICWIKLKQLQNPWKFSWDSELIIYREKKIWWFLWSWILFLTSNLVYIGTFWIMVIILLSQCLLYWTFFWHPHYYNFIDRIYWIHCLSTVFIIVIYVYYYPLLDA